MKKIIFALVVGLATQTLFAQNVMETKKVEQKKTTSINKTIETNKDNTGKASEKAPAQNKGKASEPAAKPGVKNETKEAVQTTSASESVKPVKPAIPAAKPKAPATFNAEIVYTIVNHNGMLLEAVNGGGKSANVITSVEKNIPSQKWRLIPADGNFYYIINEAQRFTLDIEGRVDYKGKNIRIWIPNGSNAQKYKLIPIGNNQYWIQTSNGYNVCTTGTNNGANVQLITAGQDVLQRWTIK